MHGIEDADLSPNGHVLALRGPGPGGDAWLVSDARADLAGVWAVRRGPPGRAVAVSPHGLGQVVWEHSPGGDRGDVILSRGH